MDLSVLTQRILFDAAIDGMVRVRPLAGGPPFLSDQIRAMEPRSLTHYVNAVQTERDRVRNVAVAHVGVVMCDRFGCLKCNDVTFDVNISAVSNLDEDCDPI